MSSAVKTKLNPKKLLLSKWTSVSPQNKEKHFLVTKLIAVEPLISLIETVELEAVHSRRGFLMPWRELCDQTQWLQGWR